MLTCTPYAVKKATAHQERSLGPYCDRNLKIFRFNDGGFPVAEVKIEDGIIKILQLEIQDPKTAKILAAYPETRWCEMTRRALKIGLGYLKGGEDA